MKQSLFAYVGLFTVMAFVLGAEPIARTISSPDDQDIALAELPKIARDRIASLRPGLSRSQVEEHFAMNGGVNGPLNQRYYLRNVIVDSKYVMVEIAFQPAKMPDDVYAGQQRAIQWCRDHHSDLLKADDVLRGTSKPFRAHRAID